MDNSISYLLAIIIPVAILAGIGLRHRKWLGGMSHERPGEKEEVGFAKMWSACDFGILDLESPVVSVNTAIFTIPEYPQVKVYAIATLLSSYKQVLEETDPEFKTISISLGDAHGQYTSQGGYEAGVVADEQQAWIILVRILGKNTDEVEASEADIQLRLKVWEILERNLRLKTSESLTAEEYYASRGITLG